jgi:hypothetical protein
VVSGGGGDVVGGGGGFVVGGDVGHGTVTGTVVVGDDGSVGNGAKVQFDADGVVVRGVVPTGMNGSTTGTGSGSAGRFDRRDFDSTTEEVVASASTRLPCSTGSGASGGTASDDTGSTGTATPSAPSPVSNSSSA